MLTSRTTRLLGRARLAGPTTVRAAFRPSIARTFAVGGDSQPTDPVCAFVGLGAMGYPMAANLQKGSTSAVLVYNRTTARAVKHAAEHGTTAAPELGDLREARVVFTCLPTSEQVAELADKLKSVLQPGAVLVDCTSGDPRETRRIAATLAEHGIEMVDSPVSGGPAGAASGQITAMLGGSSSTIERITPLIARMAQKKIVPCGVLGSGHAVKVVNNTLNTAHLAIAAEGLIALAKFGVAPDVALAAINESSGQSLQTKVRMPVEVLSREFDYGFQIGLMCKDVSICVDSVCNDADAADGDSTAPPRFFPLVKQLLEQAVEAESPTADYTKVVRPLEAHAGIELHPKDDGADIYVAKPYKP